MDLIQLAKLQTQFVEDQRYTRHIKRTSQPGQRSIEQADLWERGKFLGQGGYGTVFLEKCVKSNAGNKGKARAVKIVEKSREVHHKRELEAIVLFSYEKASTE